MFRVGDYIRITHPTDSLSGKHARIIEISTENWQREWPYVVNVDNHWCNPVNLKEEEMILVSRALNRR